MTAYTSKNLLHLGRCALIKAIYAFLFVAFSSGSASALEFSANFNVEAFGISLGTGSQSLICSDQDCLLTSSAKPEGIAKLFIKESITETIQLSYQADQLNWQSYRQDKLKKNQTKSESVFRKEELILHNTKSKQWAYSDNVFDAISMPYAIRWRLIHNQNFENMVLQDFKQQHQLKLLTQTHTHIQTALNPEPLKILKLNFQSKGKQIKLLMIEKLDFFPYKIEIYDPKKDQTVMLTLINTPELHELGTDL